MQFVSPYIVALIVAWLLSHIVKYVIATIQGKRLDLTHQLFISGGMPSSHAATSVAVGMVILLRDGVQSGVFGLATLVVLVICYDAVKVRRSSGEQGAAIQQLIRETGSSQSMPRAAKGHTPVEVLAGSALGVLIGVVVFLATR
jgi:acid phosphatase family membrane protein YuiD